MSSLSLKHASASRPSGEWRDDDYDVLADGVVLGRIFKAAASLVARSRGAAAVVWAEGKLGHRRARPRPRK